PLRRESLARQRLQRSPPTRRGRQNSPPEKRPPGVYWLMASTPNSLCSQLLLPLGNDEVHRVRAPNGTTALAQFAVHVLRQIEAAQVQLGRPGRRNETFFEARKRTRIWVLASIGVINLSNRYAALERRCVEGACHGLDAPRETFDASWFRWHDLAAC